MGGLTPPEPTAADHWVAGFNRGEPDLLLGRLAMLIHALAKNRL